MNTEKQSKINKLLASTPSGVVLLSSWLKEQGYSLDLQKRYRNSGWLVSIGTGAMIRAGHKLDYYGALYALQTQANLHIHIAGRSAFSVQGKAHYLELSPKKIVLLGAPDDKLPAWFKQYKWEMPFEYHTSEFLPADLGLITKEIRDFKIKVSNEIRALMECLFLAPTYQELSECYELMEGMNNVRPKEVQTLLEQCTSIKVKRLFLCLAERLGHAWFRHLDLSNIDLGKGKRSVVKQGLFDAKYNITIPRSWEHDEP